MFRLYGIRGKGDDGLLWPLAITYLSATRGGFEIVQKANAYLKLFEFVTLYLGIKFIEFKLVNDFLFKFLLSLTVSLLSI